MNESINYHLGFVLHPLLDRSGDGLFISVLL